MLLWHLSSTLALPSDENERCRTLAYSLLKKSLDAKASRRLTFLCGQSGLLAVASVVFQHETEGLTHRLLKELQALSDQLTLVEDASDELLYGRTGYLYSLLFVVGYHGTGSIQPGLINKICLSIISSGHLSSSTSDSGNPPLLFKWHKKEYFGAAHGYAGILYCLLQEPCITTESVKDSLLEIQSTLDWLLCQTFTSDNLPSSAGNSNDRLVQWCHGAPGFVPLLIRAYEVFKKAAYLAAAERCCDVVWERGLLRKSLGLCHGTAGNGYSFLSMFNFTGSQKHLYRALKFAEWCAKADEKSFRIPDRPNSLYEGRAGLLYFYCDLIHPQRAKFPGFELPPIEHTKEQK